MPTISEYWVFSAGLTVGTQFKAPAGSLTNTMISASTVIDADKIEHRHQAPYSDESNTTIGNTQHALHMAHGNGTIVGLYAGLQTAMVGAATADVDLLKNGSVITSSRLAITNATAAWSQVSTTSFSNTTVSSGDVFAFQITNAAAGGGTLGKGFFCAVAIDETT